MIGAALAPLVIARSKPLMRRVGQGLVKIGERLEKEGLRSDGESSSEAPKPKEVKPEAAPEAPEAPPEPEPPTPPDAPGAPIPPPHPHLPQGDSDWYENGPNNYGEGI